MNPLLFIGKLYLSEIVFTGELKRIAKTTKTLAGAWNIVGTFL
jgi:hypothetical protein